MMGGRGSRGSGMGRFSGGGGSFGVDGVNVPGNECFG